MSQRSKIVVHDSQLRLVM